MRHHLGLGFCIRSLATGRGWCLIGFRVNTFGEVRYDRAVVGSERGLPRLFSKLPGFREVSVGQQHRTNIDVVSEISGFQLGGAHRRIKRLLIIC